MDIKNDLMKICSDVRLNEPMSRHTSFKIGGAADIFCMPHNGAEMKVLVKYFKSNSIDFMIMGNGSNMLVGDGGIRGAVIKPGGELSQISASGDEITAGAGVLLSKAANTALANELSGMEALSGIPGSVGGAVSMNAGAYGTEIGDVLKEVTFIDENLETKTLSADKLGLSYRKSIFTDTDRIILSAVFKLKKGSKEEIAAAMREFTKRRTEKQPLSYPSAGSVFKRPEGHFAGKLIEDCGLKGYSIGGAEISKLHAGFIINYDNATAEDVKNLIKYTQERVFEKFGVKLEPEIKIIGE